MKHKVAFLSPVSFFKGGAEKSLFDLMRNPYISPFLIAPAEGPVTERAREYGIPTAVLPFGHVESIRRPLRPLAIFRAMNDWIHTARSLKQIAKDNDIELVHSNGLKAHAINGLSRKLGGVPCVFHIRDIALSNIEKKIWRILGKVSSHTVLVSHACWPDKQLPENVSVIFNSMPVVDIDLASPVYKNYDVVIGICGRIHPFKGHHLAVEWVKAARDRGINVALIIRGEAQDEDLEYMAKIKKQARAAKLEGDLFFEGRKEGLAEIYGGLNAVLVPSQTPDPLPRSVMEAMAVGLPVIGYPAGGIVEMIDHGENGWLAQNADEFCAAITEISQLETKRNILKENTSQTVMNKFNEDSMFQSLNDVYGAVISEN